MFTKHTDVAVIGAGPAGLAAAIAAKTEGAQNVLIIERDTALGGILQQCIHPGFGLSYFNKELTGPEYAGRFIEKIQELDIDIMLKTMVLEVLPDGTIICANDNGIAYVYAKSVVLAMGCRERTRGNIKIPGTRPAGVYTAGAAQRLINRQNIMVGRRVVILGSGDIGMIMARRMTLEGAKVVAVVEILDYLAGLIRNKVQCLDDFNIPLLLSHTVTSIVGNQRVKGVKIAQVDADRKILQDTEQLIECDTLLLSVGLIPENELSRNIKIDMCSITNGPIVNQYMQTSIPTLFASGNVVHVNDLADNVSVESEIAGRSAAMYAMERLTQTHGEVICKPGENVRYICPQRICLPERNEDINLFFRVLSPEKNVCIIINSNGKEIYRKKVRRVNPGEMECVQVHTNDLAAGVLVIDVKEG